MQEFVAKLVDLTHCSTEYAVAAWHTLTEDAQARPYHSAVEYVERFALSKKDFD